MENFTLELHFQIAGIGSASGLVYNDNSLFEYQIQEKELSKIKLFEDGQENIRKKDKFDFETISLKENKLHILGSGSTSKREKRFVYDLDSKTVSEKELSKVYQNLKQTTSISDDELNIEGAIFLNENWLLFQRGNRINSKNGIFKTNSLKKDFETEFFPINLPKIKEIETSFTDAIVVEDKIYFLAAAENTTSTYDDGEILGSILGKMNCQTFEIEYTQKISDTHKFEGLTIYKKTETKIEFLLCEDNDSDVLETTIYKLTL
jgi:hypothetical protein